jgi:hypothetical protein
MGGTSTGERERERERADSRVWGKRMGNRRALGALKVRICPLPYFKILYPIGGAMFDGRLGSGVQGNRLYI